MRRKDGSQVAVIDSARTFKLQDEMCVLSIVHDMSGVKQAEKILSENEEKYHTLIQNITAGVVVHGADTKIAISNSMAQELLGLTEEQLLGKTAIDPAWHFFLENGEVAPISEYPVNLVFKTKKSLRDYVLRVHRLEKKDDIWVLCNADPVFGEKGKISQVVVTFVDITDLKKVELEREQFLSFFDMSTDMMVIADPKGSFLKVNSACFSMLGFTQKEMMAKPFIYFVHPDDKQSTLEEQARQIKIGTTMNFENRYICKDGSVRWLSWRAIYDKKNNVTYGTARDVTERKKGEIELSHKNRALKMVSNINQALIHISDETVLLNDACRISVEVGGYMMAWVGFAQSDKVKTVSPVARYGVGTSYVDTANINWANDEHGRGPTGTAIRLGITQMARDIANDSKMIPWREAALGWGFKSSIALPLINEGKTFGALTIYAGESDAFSAEEVKILEELANDLSFGIITQRSRIEQKKMTEVIRRNERALMEAQRIGHFGNWNWDAITDKIFWSEEYYRIIGFDPKKEPPNYIDHLKIYTPESAARLDAAVKINMKTGESYTLDLEIASPKASCRWITARSETIYDDNGKVVGLRGTAQDITERKLSEQKMISLAIEREKALQDAQKLATVVESTFEAIALIDLNKTNLLIYVNKAWEQMFGYKKDEVIGKIKAPVLDAIGRDAKMEKYFWDCIKNGKMFSGQIEWQKKNGELFWADVNTVPLLNGKGEIYS